MKAMTLIFLTLLLVVFLPSIKAVPLKGIITSDKGTPLSGVQVLSYAPLKNGPKVIGIQTTTRRHEVTTDQNGLFTLPDHGRVVYFRRNDLAPITKILDMSATKADIVMQDASPSMWKIPACSSLPDHPKRVGIVFKVLLPENVPFRKREGVDSDEYMFGFDAGGNRFEVMVNWGGSTSIEPQEELLLESKTISERLWASGQTIGHDLRGVKSSGLLWRRVSFRWGAISYQGNSEKSAKIFDKLIDNVCFDEPAMNK